MTLPLQTALSGLLADATGEPWLYRPALFDDWGWIRGPDRYVVAMARAGRHCGPEEESAHRQAGTDPYGPNAALIVAAVRAVRWAHSDVGIEAIAAQLGATLWHGLGLGQVTPEMFRKHAREKQWQAYCEAARAIVAAVAEAGVGNL